MKITLKTINYFFLALALLWPPLQRGVFNVDGKGRILFFTTLAILVANVFLDKRFINKYILSKPMLFWSFWVLFSVINLIVQGYHGELPLGFYFVLNLCLPFVVMIITIKETVRDTKSTFWLFTILFSIYAILSVTVLNVEAERIDGRIIGALGNAGPLNTLFIIFFGALLFVNKQAKLNTVLPLILFAFIAIVLSATRKAFGAGIIITIMLIVSQLKFSVKNVVLVSLLSVSLYFGYNYAINETIMGGRLEEGTEAGMAQNTTNIKALDLLGDRVFFYITGWDVFQDNWLAGIGLKNFMQETKSSFVIHSEYIVQLAEGGVIGSALFLLFYFWIGKNLLKTWRKAKAARPMIWVLAGGFIAILFINFTAWTYEYPQYFAAFGVMIGYIKKFQNENSFS